MYDFNGYDRDAVLEWIYYIRKNPRGVSLRARLIYDETILVNLGLHETAIVKHFDHSFYTVEVLL